MSDDINKPDSDNVSPQEQETPNLTKAKYRPVDENKVPFAASEYINYRTPLSMHHTNQVANESTKSWGSMSNVDMEEKLSNLFSLSTPNSIGERAFSRPGSEWAQTLQGPTKEIGVRQNGQALGSAHSIISSLTGSGTPITLFMPASGFYVTFDAPDEMDLCDYDFSYALESSIVGVSTTGMLLNASSGIYLAHQINFALNHVSDCSLVHNRENIRTKILSHLDERDYGFFVLAPLVAKFLGGYPFTLECSVGTCNNKRDAIINLARILWYDRKALTKKQLELAEKFNHSSSMDEKSYLEYRGEHSKIKESRPLIHTTPGGDCVYFTLEHCSIGEYIDHSTKWVKNVSDDNNVVMSTLATEKQRHSHLAKRAESRRLLRYAHLVKSIDVETDAGELSSITDKGEIEKQLIKFCAKPTLVREVERKIGSFIVASSISLVGYMAFECDACGAKPEPGMEFVAISPDSVFFTLAHQVSLIVGALTEVDG